MTDLLYAPASELARIRSLGIPAEERAALFANVGRLNALYMIARAGSGHIGTTFSCLDVVSWLFLEELRTTDGDDGAEDVYFSSKGHDVPALYAVMIGTERLPFDQDHIFDGELVQHRRTITVAAN